MGPPPEVTIKRQKATIEALRKGNVELLAEIKQLKEEIKRLTYGKD